MKRFIVAEKSDTITRYFNEVNKCDLLSIEEENELTNRIVNGDKEAINELVEGNLKFAISVAKGYQGLGLSLSDLINDGNIGLIKAANKFDPTRGFRFISYAVYWIRQSIMQSLNDNSRVIRLPSSVINKISQLEKENEEYLESIPKEYPSCLSLNKKMGEYTGFALEDTISSEEDLTDTFSDESDRLKKVLNKTMDCLTNRERGIIECYYGLNTKVEPMTLEAIGDRYDLTKERIRQIKEKAIRRLRHNNLGLYKLIKNS